MNTQPEKEHGWLQKLVGEWVYQGEALEPGKPLWKFEGRAVVRSVGGFWIIAEETGDMPGGGPAQMQMITTLGFNPRTGRFVGTWIGSMMGHLWVYEGFLDESQRVLTLDSEGPSMTEEGKMAKYRDLIEIESDDRRVLRGNFLGADGKWQEMMSSHYRRVK